MATKKQSVETGKKVYVSNRPNISMKELKKMFPFMTEEELERDMQNNEWIKLEKFLEQERKTNEDYRMRAEQPDVVELNMSTEWKRNRTWGNCPHVYWSCYFADGSYKSGHESATGCGYDKESTCMAKIFKQCCSGMLWRKTRKKSNLKNKPYGIYMGYFPFFEGGVGVSCYYSIAEFLGGKMKHTGWTDRTDSYTVTFPVKKSKKVA